MSELKLCLMSGGVQVGVDELTKVATPAATETWHPIPHQDVYTGIRDAITRSGLRVVQESHALARDGARYFGLLELENGENATDYRLIAGIRNSHDQSYPVGLAVGSKVFVCDNLAFSGEIRLARKHTSQVRRDLPHLIHRAVGMLGGLRHHQAERIDAYKRTLITDVQAHDLIIQALDARVLAMSNTPKVLKEWRAPRHPEFTESKNVWRLFNAYTETMKETNVFALPKQTQALHGVMDRACDLV